MNKTMTTTESVKQFAEMIEKGINCWLQAGEIAAREIEANPDWPDEVCAKYPFITPARVYDFQKIGLKKVHPRLYLSDAPGVRALRKLPYSTQERFISAPVDVLVSNGETLKVDIHNMTREQADQVFAGDSVRTTAAQRAWIETKKMKDSEPPMIHAVTPYIVQRDKLKVNEPGTVFSRKDLIQILSQME